MSEASASTAVAVRPRARTAVTPLHRVRRIGYGVLGLQLLGFLTWSAVLSHRYALTWDFSVYHQAWYLIAHGDLDPYDTVQQFPFWANHCEFILWPLALFYWVWPHDVTLPWIQDFALVGAEIVVFTWICEIASRRERGKAAPWFAAAGLTLLVANPWMWETVSWDYHSEPLMVFFLTLVVRDVANGRRRAWVWVLPLLACGDVAATCVVGVGLGAALMSRSTRWRGLALAAAGLGATLLITLIHGNLGSGEGLRIFSYLAGSASSSLTLGALVKGIVTHPLIAVRAILAKRTNIWSNLGPTGVLGAGFPLLLPVAVVVLLENNLFPGMLFSAPGFQTLALYVLLPAGTVTVLTTLHGRYEKTALAIGALIVAQALGWTLAWSPGVPGSWLRVSGGTAATLAAIQARIPGDDEVIASQGISGGFSGRKDIVPIMSPARLPVHGETWFVIVPTAGIETLSTASAMALMDQLAGPLGARLVTAANGVWAFTWDPPAGTSSVTVPNGLVPLEAWTAPGAAGRAVVAGPVAGWHVSGTGAQGYVSDGLAWQVPAGGYRAEVTLAASGPVNVEVWDDTNDTLLARRAIQATDGAQPVTMPVGAPASAASVYSGWGPFRTAPIQPSADQRLEVRVWSPGGEAVSVYSADLTPSATSSSSSRVPLCSTSAPAC